MKKRILSGLLVAAMLLASLSTAAFAADDTNVEAPDTGETQTILPQSEGDAEQSTVTAPSYEVSTTAELSNALTQIATSADTEATIVLKADVTLSNDATSGYISFFGANGKHITVKSDEGEMKKLSFPSYGVLTGDCTFDNVNVTGSRLFCNGNQYLCCDCGKRLYQSVLFQRSARCNRRLVSGKCCGRYLFGNHGRYSNAERQPSEPRLHEGRRQ